MPRKSVLPSPPLTLSSQDSSDDACNLCGDGGRLVLCSSCDIAYHFDCAEAPFSEENVATSTDWFCANCTSRQQDATRRFRSNIFHGLLSAGEKQEPSFYRPPAEIINFFEGVRANSEFEYDGSVPGIPV